MQGFQLLEQCFRKECGAQELDAPPAQQFQASSILSPNLFFPPFFLASSPLHPARDMVSTKDLALALAASCTSEDKKHSRRRKRTRLWTGGFKIETMTAHSQVHGKSITQFISPAGPCSIIKVSMLRSGDVQKFGDCVQTVQSLKRLMSLTIMLTVMVALLRPFAMCTSWCMMCTEHNVISSKSADQCAQRLCHVHEVMFPRGSVWSL